MGRAGEQRWDFCRDEDHAGASYLALRSPPSHTELRGHPAPGGRAAKGAGEVGRDRAGFTPMPSKNPASPICLNGSTPLSPIVPVTPHCSKLPHGRTWNPVHAPPPYWGYREGQRWPMNSPHAPAARLVLLGTADGGGDEFWDCPLLTSHCRWGGMLRIWIFLLLQRQSPGLGSPGMAQQEGKGFMGLSGSW